MSALTAAAAEARAALTELYASLRATGCAAPRSTAGQLIRPLLSLAGARGGAFPEDGAFWAGAAAVQLAHEASLLHDDVIDGAPLRRGVPTLVAERGVAAALVQGDHLLTTSYRLAAATSSPAFASAFAHAVERTVAGEKLQGEATGYTLDERTYRRVVAGKSGELLGCALAVAAFTRGDGRAPGLHVLGRSIGVLYQMLDDLLDYCTAADTGKAPLLDFAQQRWTWPLLELDGWSFDDDASTIAARLVHVADDGSSPLRRALQRLEREADMLRAAASVQLPGDDIIDALLRDWVQRAADAVRATEHAAALHAVTAHAARAAEPRRFFAGNSRSFSFAARLFPATFRTQTERVYAFCRVTDDIADTEDGSSALERLARLDVWQRLARDAYAGRTTGMAVIDEAMTDAARAGVPLAYIDALIDGMRMDLRGVRYPTLHALHGYSYRVAGVVGQWLTRLCGVHDPDVLERAAALGHALQLTNILRDVGEDLARGRIYLPADLMAAHGIDRDMLHAFAAGAPVSDDYARLIERLMAEADADYARALQALPQLPPWFRRPVLVAAHVYRGIHQEIRARGYDNLQQRAVTSTLRKVGLGAGALAGVPRPAQRTLRHARVVLITLVLMAAAALVAGLDAQPAAVLQRHHEAAAAAAAAPEDPARQLDLLRTTFFVAVDDERAPAAGLRTIAALRSSAPGFTATHAALLTAYEGALTALQAKHGSWPPRRLRHGRRGLALLDRAVAAAPEHAEVRYLRLINLYYLPALFGRRDDVQRDVGVLTRLLQQAGQPHPPDLHRVMTGFLLANARLGAADAAALRARMES